jgi:protein ImuA
MFANPALETLRKQIAGLEEAPRRFSQTIPVAELVDRWLPYGGLPTGCIHEVKGTSLASVMAISSILSARIASARLVKDQGNIIYIAPDHTDYPLGLLPYGVRLGQILHIHARRAQHRVWAAMESLRCPQVSAVVAWVDALDLTESRRLQLAAEASGATGFLLGISTATCIAAPITRWMISSSRGGAGHRLDEPVWDLHLLYCRGGRPGKWTLQWRGQKLRTVLPQPAQQAKDQPAKYEALAG